jgi:hypothetical protein
MESSLADRPTQGRILVVADDGSLVHDPAVRRMAREFARSGLAVELRTPARVPQGRFDFCILGDLVELLARTGGDSGRRRIDAIRRASDVILNYSPDRVLSSRYQLGLVACREFGVDHILDVGFIPQDVEAACHADISYHFVFDGLTHEEAGERKPEADDRDRRFIPWAIVDRQTPKRVALTSMLVNRVSSHGFVYLPDVHPHEKEGPRPLDPGQMDRILETTQFYVWRGEHERLYLESSRFRACRQAGCLPLEVVGDEATLPGDLPFRDFVVRERDVADRLQRSDFEAERRSFQAEFLRRPRLGEGLEALITELGGPRGRPGLAPRPTIQTLNRCA